MTPRVSSRRDDARLEPEVGSDVEASGETNVSERRAARRPTPANIGRISTGWGVGIEALASPIGA